jgi:transglutaminase-like putative cysteine protease
MRYGYRRVKARGAAAVSTVPAASNAVLTIAAALIFALPAGDALGAGPGGAKTATFQVRHELKLTVPDGARNMRIWFAYPQEDPAQSISDMKIESPYPHRLGTDSEGNRSLYVEVTQPETKEFSIVENFRIERRETRSGVDAGKTRPITDADRKQFGPYLQANANVVIDGPIRTLASEIVGTEANPVRAARKIYDWELANIDYWVKDPANKKASPVGSTTYCLSTKTGNCTDFHSLWTSLARASGIPTRMVYGSFLKAELNGQDRDQSYHCWPEFWVPDQGWVPHDVAVADIFVGDFALNEANSEKVRLTTADGYTAADPAKVDYYFGNLDERRVTWSRGRDLTLDPKQEGGPVNALAKAYVEVDGKPADEKTVWNRKLTYAEVH